MFEIPRGQQRFEQTPFPGVELCSLWSNDEGGGSALVRMREGATFPMHRHVGWEQVYVLEGAIQLGEARVEAGGYLHTAPGEAHDGCALSSLMMLVWTEKAIEFV